MCVCECVSCVCVCVCVCVYRRNYVCIRTVYVLLRGVLGIPPIVCHQIHMLISTVLLFSY